MGSLQSWTSTSHRPSAVVFDKRAYVFTGWDRGRVWDGVATVDHAAGIDGPSQSWGGDNTTAAGNVEVGDHRVRYRYFDQTTGNFSPPSNAVTITVASTAKEITFQVVGGTEIEQSSDSRVSHIILEATGVDGTTFYEADREANDGVTELVYNLADADLAAGGELSWPIEVGTVYPPLFRFATVFRSRIWGAGHVQHTDGTVAVTNGSATVTGTSTNWVTDGIDGYYIEIGGVRYRISSVASATSLTLTENYAGSNDSGLSYRIYTEDDLVMWSEANYPEVFFGTNAISLWASCTGLSSHGNDLLIFSQSSMDRLTYDSNPALGVRRSVPGNRGAVTHHAICKVEGVVYALDAKGIYAYQGGSFEHLSKPVDLALAEQIDQSTYADAIHAEWLPLIRAIRWYYVERGSSTTTPHRYVQLEIDRQAWSFGELDVAITGSENNHDGRITEAPIIGDENGYLWLDDLGEAAGSETATPAVVTVATGTSGTTIELTANTFNSDTLDGVGVYQASSGETRIVSSNDDDTLTLASAFTTDPAVGEELVVGRLVSRWRSRAHYMDDDSKTRKRGVYCWLHFHPQTSGKFTVRFYRDLSSSAVTYEARALRAATGRCEEEGITVPAAGGSDFVVDMSKVSDGVAKIPLGADPWRVAQVEVEVTRPQTKLILYGYKLTSGEGRQTNA